MLLAVTGDLNIMDQTSGTFGINAVSSYPVICTLLLAMSMCCPFYFTAGTMEQPLQLQPNGSDFVTALKKKYQDEDEVGNDLGFQILVAKPRCSIQNDGKEHNPGSGCGLVLPSIVSLNGYDIVFAGPLEEIGQQAAIVTELDLAQNLIRDWSEVYKLLAAFPRLQFLNLSFNPLNSYCTTGLDSLQCRHLKRLILNQTHVPHSLVDALLETCPSLDELHLSLSQYPSIDLDVTKTHTNVRTVHFNANSVADWHELAKIGLKFPMLENLSLAETNLSEIGTDDLVQCFSSLRTLILSSTQLSTWEQLERLNSFPVLESVKLREIPLIKNVQEKLSRQLLIAHLPRITMLNSSPVAHKEREDAERAAIRYYMDSSEQPERYHKLVSQHGNLDRLVDVDLSPELQFTVKITHADRVRLMKVDVRWAVKDLKKRIADWCGLRPSQFALYIFDHEAPCGMDVLKFPDKLLLSVGVRDGIEFQVREKIQCQKTAKTKP